MINSNLQSMVEDFKVLTDASVTMSVDVTPSVEMTEEVAKSLKAELDRVAPYAGYLPVSQLTVEDIERYLKSLLWLRVKQCNHSLDTSVSQYRPEMKRYSIPVLWYQLLICVGRAHDREFNIEFKPAYSIDGEDLLSVDEMHNVSEVFASFENAGIKLVFGVPTDVDGELDFMAMSHVEQVVKSYRRSHPVYGFLAAFIRQQELNQITGTMSRVIYGYDSDYVRQVSALMRAISG